jgi:hypothetical protein
LLRLCGKARFTGAFIKKLATKMIVDSPVLCRNAPSMVPVPSIHDGKLDMIHSEIANWWHNWCGIHGNMATISFHLHGGTRQDKFDTHAYLPLEALRMDWTKLQLVVNQFLIAGPKVVVARLLDHIVASDLRKPA